jgi:hypothetical protein
VGVEGVQINNTTWSIGRYTRIHIHFDHCSFPGRWLSHRVTKSYGFDRRTGCGAISAISAASPNEGLAGPVGWLAP